MNLKLWRFSKSAAFTKSTAGYSGVSPDIVRAAALATPPEDPAGKARSVTHQLLDAELLSVKGAGFAGEVSWSHVLETTLTPVAEYMGVHPAGRLGVPLLVLIIMTTKSPSLGRTVVNDRLETAVDEYRSKDVRYGSGNGELNTPRNE